MKKKVCVCASCWMEAYCADNSWSLFDKDNKKCPNYKAGMKDYKRFMKEFLKGVYD